MGEESGEDYHFISSAEFQERESKQEFLESAKVFDHFYATPKQFVKDQLNQGKHVILAAGRVYTAKTGEGAAEILRKLEKTNPNVIPEVAYLPKARSLILWS